MPGLYTHFSFGIDNYKHMKQQRVRKAVSKHRAVYNMGMQGPDIFFYFPAFPLLTWKEDKKNLGVIMHHSDTNPFFEALLNNIKEMNGESKELVIAYFAGFCGHISLDSATHPMIYYFTDYEEGKKGNFGVHAQFETEIDYNVTKRILKKHPYYIRTDRQFRLNRKEKKAIGKLLAKTCHEVYGASRKEFLYRWMLGCFGPATQLFHSKHGFRKYILQDHEMILVGYKHFSALFTIKGHIAKTAVMNDNHAKWNNYWYPDRWSRESFMERYEKGKDLYRALICQFESIIFDNRSCDEFINVLDNRSYRSGQASPNKE